MGRVTGRFLFIFFLFFGVLFCAQGVLPEKGVKKRGLDQICEKALAHKIAQSSIKRRLYHISKMKGACKKVLLEGGHSQLPPNLYSPENLRSKYTSWGIDPIFKDSWINLEQAWKSFRKNRNVVVAVIDTGIDPGHEYLKGNIHVMDGVKGKANYGRDFSVLPKKSSRDPAGRTPIDNHGHGTHVAGILRSVFPEVKILPIKYYNPNRSGQENLNSLIKSLEYAIDAGVDIINYSGGGPEPAIQELKILKRAQRNGILIIAAAGNETSDIDLKDKAFYPASYGLSNIVTVMAHDQQASLLKSSNWGKKSVDISAPGYRIQSSVPQNRARHMTGTSQATAFVSGVAAMIKSQYPELSAQDIKLILRRSVRKVSQLERKCVTGGRLDASKALAMAREYIQVRVSSVAAHR